jgi:hypothetical protein
MSDFKMRKPILQPGDERRGKLAVAAIASDHATGILHINTLVCESIQKKGDWENWTYNLRARDLHFTSYEGCTTELWNDTKLDKEKIRKLREVATELEIAQSFYGEVMLALIMNGWGEMPPAHREIYARLALGKTFPLDGKDVLKFMSRHGNSAFDAYIEKFKVMSLLDAPDESFRFMNVSGTKMVEHSLIARLLKEKFSARYESEK